MDQAKKPGIMSSLLLLGLSSAARYLVLFSFLPPLDEFQFPRGEREDRNVFTHPLSLTLIAFVVTAVPAYLLKKQIGQNLESLTVMAWALLIGGIVMWVVDALYRSPHIDRLDDMNLPRAIGPGSGHDHRPWRDD